MKRSLWESIKDSLYYLKCCLMMEEPSRKPRDTNKFSNYQTKELLSMWKSWEENKIMHKNQEEFCMNMNRILGLNKSRTAMMSHIRKQLKESTVHALTN